MRVEHSLIDDLATRDVDARPVRVYALRREAVAALPASSAPSAPPIYQPAVVPRLSIVVLPVLSASSRPAISFCNLEKRHEGCRTWAGLAVPAAAVEAPAHAVTETATKTRMHKARASEPRMEEARVTKAEASEVWTEKAAAEPAVPASAKSDGNSDRPSPARWVTPIPARWIIRVIPGVILWRIIGIALCLNGGASR